MRESEKNANPNNVLLLEGGEDKKDAEHLAGTLRKVSVADIVESMEVSVVPFSVQNHEVSTIYKLKMKLYPHELFPKNSGIKKLQDCEGTLRNAFVRELERTIESHFKRLSNNTGIKNILQKFESDSPEETAQADSGHKSKQNAEENYTSDEADDLGEDAQKRKWQKTDEMEYEDAMKDQNVEGEPLGFESENDQVEDNENSDTDEAEMIDAADESRDSHEPSAKKPKSETKRKMAGTEPKDIEKKDTDRRISGSVSFKGLEFEIHFQMKDEQHILLSQIAQRAVKNVYIRKATRIDRCLVINDTKKDGPPTIHTSGVDFHALWGMQDDLDINSVMSNDIHAIFQTYGVEAARTTIVNELRNVFSLYGISTDFRHFGLIADFMTHSGKYRPFSRHGMLIPYHLSAKCHLKLHQPSS